MQNAILKARELGEAIQNSDCFLEFQTAKEAMEADLELQKQIKEFDQKRNEMYRTMQGEQPNLPLRDRLTEEVKAMSETIMENPLMQQFNETDDRLAQMLEQINNVIQFHVNGEEQGCSPSSCASCSGGCH